MSKPTPNDLTTVVPYWGDGGEEGSGVARPSWPSFHGLEARATDKSCYSNETEKLNCGFEPCPEI